MAAQSIGGIVIDFVANTLDFKREVEEVAATAEHSGAEIEGAFAGIGEHIEGAKEKVSEFGQEFLSLEGVVNGVIGALAIGNLVEGVHSALEALKSLQVTAEQVGVSAEGLQRLQFAAIQSGVPIETLDKALLKLEVSIGKLKEGDQAATDGFNRLGLGAAVMNGQLQGTMPTFLAIADRLKSLPDQAQAAAAAGELMGARLGPQLVAFLRQGSDAIVDVMRRADEMGAVLSNETVESADDAMKSLEALWETVKRGAEYAFASLAPEVKDFTQMVKDLIPWIKGLNAGLDTTARVLNDIAAAKFGDAFNEIATATAPAIEKQIGMLEDGLARLDQSRAVALARHYEADVQRIDAQIEKTKARIDALKEELAKAAEEEKKKKAEEGAQGPGEVPTGTVTSKANQDSLAKEARAMEDRLNLYDKLQHDLQRVHELRAQGVIDLATENKLVGELENEYQDKIDKMVEADQKAAESLQRQADEAEKKFQEKLKKEAEQEAKDLYGWMGTQAKADYDDWSKTQDKIISKATQDNQKFGDSAKWLKDRLDELEQEERTGVLTHEAWARAVEEAHVKADEMAHDQSLAGIGQQLEKQNPLLADFKDNIVSTFDAVAEGSLKGKDAINSFFANMLKQLSNRALSTALDSMFGALSKALGSGGSMAGMGGFLGTAWTGLKGYMGFDRGGAFTVGGAGGGTDNQLVSFRANPGELVTVTPPELQGQGGGGGMVVSIDARNSVDPVATRRQVERALEQWSGKTQQQTVDRIRRTPGLSLRKAG